MNMLTVCKNIVGVLLLVFLLPVWMALGLGAVVVIVARQLYWWARGNTTVASRLAARARWSPRHGRAPAPDPLDAISVASPVDAPAAGALSPAIQGVSGR